MRKEQLILFLCIPAFFLAGLLVGILCPESKDSNSLNNSNSQIDQGTTIDTDHKPAIN